MLAKRLQLASEMGILIIREVKYMAKTANVFARVEPEIKEQAELVLEKLGIPMSNAVSMFLRQVVLHRGIPFDIKLPDNEPLSLGELCREEFDYEIEKALISKMRGETYSADEVEAEMKRKFEL